MPEGHTIHRLARDHTRLLAGRPLVARSPQGRFAASAARLDGHVVERFEAYGKHLFQWWDTGEVVHVHLGLFGKVRVRPADGHGVLPEAPPSVRLRLATDTVAVDLTGPTDCSLGPPELRDRIVARLGPDPLRRDADPERFDAGVARSRAPIGALLLDQSVVAGVGNVYRAEALFVCGIHPERPGRELVDAERAALWATVVSMLRQGVKDNRIVTVDRAELGRPRTRVPRREATYAYGRDHCRRCGAAIARWQLANRTMYACPGCQR
jgi:endonuclease-8